MIKLENEKVVGWEPAVRGMRNPMNSWDKSDSEFVVVDKNPHGFEISELTAFFKLGENDLNLAERLRAAGADHRKFMRMLVVYADITAPLYWWKEFDTYKVGTVANSCSTMHKITDKIFTEEDFSVEDAVDLGGTTTDKDQFEANALFIKTLEVLNENRIKYIKAKENGADAHTLQTYWRRLIKLLPSSYNQKRTIMMNYEVLANIYKSRRNHKLKEWREFCEWIKELPYSQLITGDGIKPNVGYVVLQADNVSYDLFTSQLFTSKASAQAHMLFVYNETLENLEGRINGHNAAEDWFKVEAYGDEVYYGTIREIELPDSK